MIRVYSMCRNTILFILVYTTILFSEGMGNFGGVGQLSQYLSQSSELFIHVPDSNSFIRFHLVDYDGQNVDVEASVFSTSLDNDGRYTITGNALETLRSNRGNIDRNDPLNTLLPATPAIGQKMEFAATAPGVYGIRFTGNSEYLRWDISVTTDSDAPVDPTAKPGLLFSYNWRVYTHSFAEADAMSSLLYALVPGGYPNTNYVWALDLQNFSGNEYELSANDIGLSSPYSGYSVAEASSPAPELLPKFPVYLNYPKGAAPFPEPTVAPTLSDTFVFVSKDAANKIISPNGDNVQDEGTFQFTPTATGTYAIIFDLDRNGIYGNANDRILLGAMTAGEKVSVPWFGEDEAGNTVPNGQYSVQLHLRLGEYHFVTRDAETSGGGTNNGLTIFRSPDATTLAGTKVYWEDETYLGGTSVMPEGKLSLPGQTNGDFRHTWGAWDNTGIGNESFIDTYVYGLSSIPLQEKVTVVDTAGTNHYPELNDTIPDMYLIENFQDLTVYLTTFFSDQETADEDLVYTLEGDSLVSIIIVNGIAQISSLSDSTGVDTVIFAVQDESGLTVNDTVMITIDGTAPNIISVTPADDATDIPVTTNLTITFSEAIQTGTGTIVIYTADGTPVETIASDSSAVSITGSSVTISPSGTLTPGESYYILIDSGSFTDLVGNDNPGITDSTEWNFTTSNSDPILLDTISDIAVEENSGTTIVTDLDSIFSDQNQLTFEVFSLDSSIATGSVDNNGTLSVTVADNTTGETDIIVTANDGITTVSDTFHVTVTATNQDPVKTDTIADTMGIINTTTEITADLNSYFTDTDSLTYSVVSLDSSVAIGTIDNNKSLDIDPVGIGETDVIVTATDTYGSTVSDTLHIVISPNEINDISVSNKQNDTTIADMDTIYGVTSSISVISLDSSIAIGTVDSNGVLTITFPDSIPGETDIIVTAINGSATVSDTIHVTFYDAALNNDPVLLDSVPDPTISITDKNSTVYDDISSLFSDTDSLTYSLISLDSSIATGTIDSTGVIAIDPIGVGETDIIVTATDTYGSFVSDTFHVIVTPKELEDIAVTTATNDTTIADLDTIFGNNATVSAISLDNSIAIGSIDSAGVLTILFPDSIPGETEIIVTADYGNGSVLIDTITVSVTPVEIHGVVNFHLGHIVIPEMFEVLISPNPAPPGEKPVVDIAISSDITRVNVKVFNAVGDLISDEWAVMESSNRARYTWNYEQFPRVERGNTYLAVITSFTEKSQKDQTRVMIGIEQ